MTSGVTRLIIYLDGKRKTTSAVTVSTRCTTGLVHGWVPINSLFVATDLVTAVSVKFPVCTCVPSNVYVATFPCVTLCEI
jgi:hypothetical protein